MKPRLIIVGGPTASGKTSASIRLAKAIGGEIISADSVQVYRGMDIGSAKIRPCEMEGVPHHLIDVLDPAESFDVARFVDMAKEAAYGIYERGHCPIVCGGTGFYVQALLYDVDFSVGDRRPELTEKWEDYYRRCGRDALFSALRAVDPESAAIIPCQNIRRVIRALEFYDGEGYPISRHNKAMRDKASPYDFDYFVLNPPRQKVYEAINARVDLMIKEGLVEEVKRLLAQGVKRNLPSMQALGYRQIAAYLEGEMTLEEAVCEVKLQTRHFAKRQMTWYRREREVCFIPEDICERGEAASYMMDYIKDKET